jgi:phenylalanyl-tRNA synthetase beta chain
MPTVAVDKADLFERLGREYSTTFTQRTFTRLLIIALLATQEFDRLCFEYGLELDEDVRDFSSEPSFYAHEARS